MEFNENENALKGQHILAQGSALDLVASREIVRATAFIKENWLFRTKKMSCNSVRKELFTLFIELPRTVFLLHSSPRATFRFVPSSILPWAELYWPFRPKENYLSY